MDKDPSKCLTPSIGRRSLPRDVQINLKRNPMPGSTKGRRQAFDFKTSRSVKAEVEKDEEIFAKCNSIPRKEGHPSHPSEIIDTQIEAGAAKLQVPQFKMCMRCSCRRPPRAKHCVECDRCVLRRDRHCYLLGCCIGFYNHKFFILTLLYSTIILGITFDDVVKYLIKNIDEVNTKINPIVQANTLGIIHTVNININRTLNSCLHVNI